MLKTLLAFPLPKALSYEKFYLHELIIEAQIHSPQLLIFSCLAVAWSEMLTHRLDGFGLLFLLDLSLTVL